MPEASLAPLTGLALRTPRLRFDRVRPEDGARLFELFADPVAMRYWSREPMRDPSEAAALVEEIQTLAAQQTLFQWALREADGERLLGTVTLCAFSLEHRRCEIGYMLDRQAWGAGLMHEALSALIGRVFETTGLYRIGADVDPRNRRSIALLHRLGFRDEGLQRATWRLHGEVQDSRLLGLLADDWPPAA